MRPVAPVVLEVDLALGALPPAGRAVSRGKGPTPGCGWLQTGLAGWALGPAHLASQEPHVRLCLPRREAPRAWG